MGHGLERTSSVASALGAQPGCAAYQSGRKEGTRPVKDNSQPTGSNPLEALDPAFIVPSVGGWVMLNGETYLVTHAHVATEMVRDQQGKYRHTLKVQFCGSWDDEGYQEPDLGGLI